MSSSSVRVRNVTPMMLSRLRATRLRSISAARPPVRPTSIIRPHRARAWRLPARRGAPTVSMMTSTPRPPEASSTVAGQSGRVVSTTTSAPRACRASPLEPGDRVVANTCSAPSSRAIWIEAVPTPDDPAVTMSVSPALSRPLVTMASWLVMNTLGTAAASSQDQPSGTGTRKRASRVAYSAAEAGPRPITRSPTEKPSTPGPRASTVPANSMPAGTGSTWEGSPRSTATTISTPRLSPEARTRTRASPGPGSVTGTSRISNDPPSGPATTNNAFIERSLTRW